MTNYLSWAVKSGVKSCKFYHLLPDKENTGQMNTKMTFPKLKESCVEVTYLVVL